MAGAIDACLSSIDVAFIVTRSAIIRIGQKVEWAADRERAGCPRGLTGDHPAFAVIARGDGVNPSVGIRGAQMTAGAAICRIGREICFASVGGDVVAVCRGGRHAMVLPQGSSTEASTDAQEIMEMAKNQKSSDALDVPFGEVGPEATNYSLLFRWLCPPGRHRSDAGRGARSRKQFHRIDSRRLSTKQPSSAPSSRRLLQRQTSANETAAL